jgi:hypothetical protein
MLDDMSGPDPIGAGLALAIVIAFQFSRTNGRRRR